MSGTNDNYENRYLEEIKSKGFIQKLKHDAKSKNCAASRRLYTRVKKSFKNKDKKRRLNKNDNILLYNTMARNGNAKYTRNKNCAGNFVLGVNLVNIQKQTLEGPFVGSETFTGSQQFMKSNLVQTTTKEKVSSWLSYNIEDVSPTPLHVDPHKAIDNYSDIYPPSYSFKDNYSPVNPNQQKVNVFHVEKGKPNGTIMKEHVLGVTDDNFRSSGGNDLNHKIHQCIWCPCFFFFTVLCCIPAILLMTKADKYFLKNDLKEAAWHQKMSTTLYVGGFIATILFYIAIALFIVCFM